MFIRWKRRQLGGQRWMRSAVLVRSERVNGAPRLRTVRYLASVQEDHIDWQQLQFWTRVDQVFDELALDAETRAGFCAKLEQTVPRPSADARAVNMKRLAAMEQTIARALR